MPRDLAGIRRPGCSTTAPSSRRATGTVGARLVQRLAGHLVERYGRDEVATWGFEIWNEPNLEVFWPAAEYFRLYEVSARAIQVGGRPAACRRSGHRRGLDPRVRRLRDRGRCAARLRHHPCLRRPPLDLRPVLGQRGLDQVPILWTEWGLAAIHNAFVNDLAYGAPFVLRGMGLGRVSLTVSPTGWSATTSRRWAEGRRCSGGFGLLTVGNLRKPRYWALALAAGARAGGGGGRRER